MAVSMCKYAAYVYPASTPGVVHNQLNPLHSSCHQDSPPSGLTSFPAQTERQYTMNPDSLKRFRQFINKEV